MVIESYTRVLKVPWEVHQIPWDPSKGPKRLPYPLPGIGLIYFAVLEILFIAWSRLPVVGGICHFPMKLWWFVPLWLTIAAVKGTFDGRAAHAWLRAWLAWRLRASRDRAGLPVPPMAAHGRRRIRWFADSLYPRLTRARITAPATVMFHQPVRFETWFSNKAWVVRPGSHPYTEPYEVQDGRLEVKP